MAGVWYSIYLPVPQKSRPTCSICLTAIIFVSVTISAYSDILKDESWTEREEEKEWHLHQANKMEDRQIYLVTRPTIITGWPMVVAVVTRSLWRAIDR